MAKKDGASDMEIEDGSGPNQDRKRGKDEADPPIVRKQAPTSSKAPPTQARVACNKDMGKEISECSRCQEKVHRNCGVVVSWELLCSEECEESDHE